MMIELSPEEKKKIYEEEKSRLEKQKERTSGQPEKKKGTGCATVIVILAVMSVVIYYNLKKDGYISSPKKNVAKTTSTRPKAAQLPAPISANFKVKVNKFSLGQYGYYEVVGEVENIGTKAYQFVELQAQYLNEKNEVVGQETTYACSTDYIRPGGKKSYKFMGENQPDYKSVKVTIVDASAVR